MIDTLKMYIPSFSLKNDNEFKVNLKMDYSTGEIQGSKDKGFLNIPGMNFDIIPDKVTRRPTLFFQTSLPKLIHGTSLAEIKPGDLQKVKESVEEKFKVAKINISKNWIEEANLSRIDFCKNIKVDHNVSNYITALGKFEVSRRGKTDYNAETLLYYNKSQELTFYNKELEVLARKDTSIFIRKMLSGKADHKTLRQEVRLKKSSVIKRELPKYLEKKESYHLEDVFNIDLSKGKLLNEFETLVKSGVKQKINLMNLEDALQEVNFRELVSINGCGDILQACNYDFSMIRNILLNHYSKAQTYRHISHLKKYGMYSLDSIGDLEVTDLIEELRFKIAA